jgi:hypothetical protein
MLLTMIAVTSGSQKIRSMATKQRGYLLTDSRPLKDLRRCVETRTA